MDFVDTDHTSFSFLDPHFVTWNQMETWLLFLTGNQLKSGCSLWTRPLRYFLFPMRIPNLVMLGIMNTCIRRFGIRIGDRKYLNEYTPFGSVSLSMVEFQVTYLFIAWLTTNPIFSFPTCTTDHPLLNWPHVQPTFYLIHYFPGEPRVSFCSTNTA